MKTYLWTVELHAGLTGDSEVFKHHITDTPYQDGVHWHANLPNGGKVLYAASAVRRWETRPVDAPSVTVSAGGHTCTVDLPGKTPNVETR